MATQPQVSYDGRSFAERLRRVELWRACEHFEISFRAGAPAVECRALLEAHNIGDAQLMQWYDNVGNVVQIPGLNENQQPHTETYPQPPLHESARIQNDGDVIDYDAAMAERAEKAEEKVAASDEVIEKQAEMLKTAMARIEALEANAVPLDRLSPPQLKRIAKERGIDITGLSKKQELLDVLEG